jgi:excisionase family DNA binding protein
VQANLDDLRSNLLGSTSPVTNTTATPRRSEHAPLRPRLYFLPAACAALGGVSRSHLYKLRKEGKIKFTKVGGRSALTDDEIDRIAREGIE